VKHKAGNAGPLSCNADSYALLRRLNGRAEDALFCKPSHLTYVDACLVDAASQEKRVGQCQGFSEKEGCFL
jgi:hypothetical protein